VNIAIDARPLLERRGTGVYEYTRHLLDALFRISGNCFELFSNSYQYPLNLPENWRGCEKIKIVETKHPNKIFNLKLAFFRAPKLNRLIGDANLFYLPNLNFCALDRGFPYVATVHDLSFEVMPSFFGPKQRVWHGLVGVQKLLKGATKIVAVSEHTKSDITRLYKISPGKIQVIYPGLNNLSAGKTPEELRLRHFLPENFILFLGTLEKRKNVLGLISAFELLAQKIPDLHLVIAGAPGWGFAEIYARAKASKYAERILFLGYIHEDERMTFYSLAKVFVYPSFYEGFGMPPLEAMSCGTPVVTSAASSLPEAVGDAALLINPNKTDDLADAILACLTNDRLRKKLISAGAEQIKKFSWDKAVRELNDVFRKII